MNMIYNKCFIFAVKKPSFSIRDEKHKQLVSINYLIILSIHYTATFFHRNTLDSIRHEAVVTLAALLAHWAGL